MFEAAFRVLRRDYRIEYLYKACVLEKWVFGTYSPKTSALYMEFRVANARADMLFVNGRAEVLEVKTRFDDITRLSQQLEEYYRCFKSVSLIVEEHHLDRYAECLPEKVGIVALTPRYQLSVRRAPRESSEGLKKAEIFRLLRQREKSDAVKSIGEDTSKFHPIERSSVELGLFLSLDKEEAHYRMVHALQRRQPTDRMCPRSAAGCHPVSMPACSCIACKKRSGNAWSRCARSRSASLNASSVTGRGQMKRGERAALSSWSMISMWCIMLHCFGFPGPG